MAISLTIKKFNNREYAYIVENYRDPSTKRPTSRTLENYGRVDKLLETDPDAMSKREKKMLNDYHAMVYETLSPYMTEAENAWLKEYTRAI